MDLNPHTEPLEAAKSKVSELAVKLKIIESEIQWYEGTNRDELLQRCEELDQSLTLREMDLAQCELGRCRLEADLSATTAQTKSVFDPRNWFDANQREYRSQRRKTKGLLRAARSDAARLQKRVSDVREQRDAKQDELGAYDRFDVSGKQFARVALLEEHSRIKCDASELEELQRAFNTVLEPFRQQLLELNERKQAAQGQLAAARRIEAELARAENSYQRKLLHQRCEALFGVGTPARIVHQLESEIERIQRDVGKLITRVQRMARIASREIRELVVDGNNLCYEGDRFIGLDALIVLARILSERYVVTIVFDASIRRILGARGADIQRTLGADAEVHVVATREKADETVLELAGLNEGSFVISNDRFAEFREKLAVKEGRLIRHEIVGGRILVHDLGIAEYYRAS